MKTKLEKIITHLEPANLSVYFGLPSKLKQQKSVHGPFVQRNHMYVTIQIDVQLNTGTM